MKLSLKDVNKHYLVESKVVTALNSVNIELAGAGLVLICGSSGSGKTTLLNVISGTDFYTEGDYYINELDTCAFSDEEWEEARNKFFSFVYQDFKLIEDYSVKDNILLAYNVSNDKSVDINSIIKKVGLESIQNKKVRYLSGGQKQRVAIARALAKNNPVILADEPTANLDQGNSKSIAKLLYEISKDKLVVISTHNEKLFENYELRKITLSDGKIIKDEKPKKSNEINIFDNYKGILPSNHKLFGLLKNKRTSFWTTFSMLLTFLISLAVFSIGLYFTTASTKNYEKTVLFGNLSPDRYIVTKHDNSSFSSEELRRIESDPSVKSIVTNDVLADSFLQAYSEYNSTINFHIRRLSELPNDYHGKRPQNDDEIILSTMSGAGFYGYEKDSINEFHVCDEYSHNLKICETFAINKSEAFAYITDSLYNELNNELLLINSNPTLEKGGSKSNNFKFYFDDLCPKDVLISDISSMVNNNYSVDFTFLNNTIKSKELEVLNVENYKDLAFSYGSRSKYVICNSEFFYDVTRQNVFQLSVFSDKTPSFGKEYNVIYPNVINDGSIDSQAVVTLVIWFLIVLIVSIILVLANYLFLRNIYKREIRSIYIRRLLGYSKKDCRIFSLLQIVISEAIAISIILVYYFLSINSPIKMQMFVLFSNLPISLVLILLFFASISFLFLLLRLVLNKSNPYKYVEETK